MKRDKNYFKLKIKVLIVMIFLIIIVGQFHKKKFGQFQNIPNNLKVINLGTSHGLHSFNYPININGYNFAMPAQPFFYDLKILKKYRKNLSDECIVFIPISLFSFYQGYEFKRFNDRYYDFLDFKDIYEGNRKEYILRKYFPLLNNGKLIFKFKDDFFRNQKKKEIKSLMTLKEKELRAELSSSNHLGISESRNNYNSEIGINHLIELLEYCFENNFRPILVTTPVSKMYNDRVKKNSYELRIQNHLEYISKKMGIDIKYLDYSHHEIFQEKYEYFIDSDHLTTEGANIFTSIILKDLKIMNINEKK